MSSVVYFAEAADGSIKIGTTNQIDRRSANLSTAVPGGCQIICTVPGGRDLEAHWHEAFSAARISGEWFMPVPELLVTIRGVKDYGLAFLPFGFQQPDSEPLEGSLIQRRADLVEEMKRLIRQCAAPAGDGEAVSSAIARAARRVGLSVGRVTSYWYGKVAEIPAVEADLIRECAIKHTDSVELLRDEVSRLADQLFHLEPRIDAARDMARAEIGPRNPDGD